MRQAVLILHALPRRLLLAFCVLSLATISSADTQERIDPTIQDQIQALSMLSGDKYAAARNDFLANAPALPDYPDGVPEQDPRYRVQYMILQGWQQNARLYQEFERILGEVNSVFMSVSASGFDPLFDEFRTRSEREWKRAGLPYAWETLLKFEATKPGWLIDATMMMIQGYPHEESIDPLLMSIWFRIGGSSDTFVFYTFSRELLTEMPIDALNTRLNSTAPFYVKMRTELQEAVRGR